MILDGNIDDVKGFLPKEDLQRLETFERAFLRNLDEYTQELQELADASFEECEGDKKRFALEKSMFFSSTWKSMKMCSITLITTHYSVPTVWRRSGKCKSKSCWSPTKKN